MSAKKVVYMQGTRSSLPKIVSHKTPVPQKAVDKTTGEIPTAQSSLRNKKPIQLILTGQTKIDEPKKPVPKKSILKKGKKNAQQEPAFKDTDQDVNVPVSQTVPLQTVEPEQMKPIVQAAVAKIQGQQQQNQQNNVKTNLVPSLASSFVKKDTLHSTTEEPPMTPMMRAMLGAAGAVSDPDVSSTTQSSPAIPGANNQTMTKAAGPICLPGIPNMKGPGAFVCEICDINGTSKVMFETHLAGKKHRSKYQQALQNGLVDPATNNDPSLAFTLRNDARLQSLPNPEPQQQAQRDTKKKMAYNFAENEDVGEDMNWSPWAAPGPTSTQPDVSESIYTPWSAPTSLEPKRPAPPKISAYTPWEPVDKHENNSRRSRKQQSWKHSGNEYPHDDYHDYPCDDYPHNEGPQGGWGPPTGGWGPPTGGWGPRPPLDFEREWGPPRLLDLNPEPQVEPLVPGLVGYKAPKLPKRWKQAPEKERSGPPITSCAELYCGICDVTASSPQNILDHVIGKKHLKKEVIKRSGGIANIVNPSKQDMHKSLYCDVCDTQIIGIATMKAHVAGKRHISKVQKIVVGKDFLVAKGQWAVPVDGWQDFDYVRAGRSKKRKKTDGGWGLVREEDPLEKRGRGEAFIAEPTTELADDGSLKPFGYSDFTQDVFW